MKAKLKISAAILRALKRFEAAAIDQSWIGSRHPSEHAAITHKYREARHKLLDPLTPRVDLTPRAVLDM